MGMSRIRLTIDRLALHGVDPHDAKALVETLRMQLSSVLSDRGERERWARPHRTPVLRLGRLPLAPGTAGAKSFAKEMARAVGRGLQP